MIHWRRLLLADWQIKLLGLAAATVLWAYVRTEQFLQLTYPVALEFRNVPHGMRFVRRPPATLQVRLEVPRDRAEGLTPEQLRVVVDLAGRVRGKRAEIRLGPEDVSRPPGVAVRGVAPAELVLELEPGRRGAE